jgi:hypothetical protein
MKYIALSAVVAGIDFSLYSIYIPIDVSITLVGLGFVDLVRSNLANADRVTLSPIGNFAEFGLRHYAVIVPNIGIDYT